MRRYLLLLFLSPGVSAAVVAGAGADVAAVKALQQMQKGDYDDAYKDLRRAGQNALALRLLLELADRGGRLEEAAEYAGTLISLYQSGQLRSVDDLAQVAYAAAYLDRWEAANQLYIKISETEQMALPWYVDWGKLYLEKYNPQEAEGILRDGLKATATATLQRWNGVHAYIGLSRVYRDLGQPGSGEAVEEAVKLEPDNLELLAYRASLALAEDKWSEAQESIKRGLDINSEYLPLLEMRAAVHFFTDRTRDFDKALHRIEKINLKNADFYELMGDLAIPRRRLEEAVEFYSTAVKLNPRQWSALASLGINLLRLGQEEPGIAAVERAYANDPYNIWTVNTLRLLDKLQGFEESETKDFVVRLDPEEDEILRPYAAELLQKSLSALEQKYGHQIEEKVIFEMYPDHDDFAVRTLGLPGLGALGATFGTVVAMDSPSARQKGEFHWGSTLWHEIAHVITLSLSQKKVPRWLTEGLSMMEERQAAPGWGDPLTPTFVKAYREGALLPLADLNRGFVRPDFPGRVALSYFQAGLVSEFLAQRFGMAKIKEMLLAYASGSQTEDVFKTVFEHSIESIDEEFKQYLAQELDPFLEILEEPELPDNSDATLRMALEASPRNYYLNLAYGQRLYMNDQAEEAIPYLRRAMTLFPRAAGRQNPYELLTRIYLESGRRGQAIEVLKAQWENAPRKAEDALKLAQLLDEEGRGDQALSVLEGALWVDPLLEKLHVALGEKYLELKRPQAAVREFNVLLNLNPVDKATAHYNLARAYRDSGQADDARREVLLALEIAPGFTPAQQLLLEIVRP